MMDAYAVIGNPVAHSKSPQIHLQFAAQTGERLEYGRILADQGDFEAKVRAFLSGNGRGLSVTMPFKEQAFQMVDELTPRARRAGAVNMISRQPDGLLAGDNTDGAGLIADLTVNLGWPIVDRRVLVIGAGGAARGILAHLLEQQPLELVLANRTVERAVQLAREFADLGSLRGCGLEELNSCFDLVIHATGANLKGQIIELNHAALGPHTDCYDLTYADTDTSFMSLARSLGAARVADGLGMLVEQAAVQFRGWRGKMPLTSPVIRSLRA